VVAAKACVPVAHVEAGLRSFDPTMPEEVNRIVTDRLSTILLTHSPEADVNLLREGAPEDWIHRVGNIMIDSLVDNLERARSSRVLTDLSLDAQGYGILTLHRPSNVDDPATLMRIMDVVHEISAELPIVFSCHPRTAERLDALPEYDAIAGTGNVRRLPPLGYLDFLRLMSESRLALTDSGGLQEETTYLGIPCVTIRENTERPITIEQGTNTLVGTDPQKIRAATRSALVGQPGEGQVPDLWDGKTAGRIVDVFESWWEEEKG